MNTSPLEREYNNMKRAGRCPYDSLKEYIESIFYSFPFANTAHLADTQGSVANSDDADDL